MRDILKEPVRDLSAWRAKDLSNGDAWLVQLPSDAVLDVKRLLACRAYEPALSDGLSGCNDAPTRPVISILGSAIGRVLRGRGFAVVRGLPIDRHPTSDIEALLSGLLGSFGSLVPQNAKGDRIVQVYDRGPVADGTALRGYLTRSQLSFHSDPSGDVVALLCVRKAKWGGRSAVVSSTTIYNEILAHHPEFLGLLYSGFVHDRRGEQRPGEAPVSPRVPIYSWYDEDLSCRYTRAYIANGQARIGLPLTDIESALFDYMDAVANDSSNHWKFDLEPGDMLLCNNYTTLHSRAEYVDSDAAAEKRLMLRAWLAVPNARHLAENLSYWYAP